MNNINIIDFAINTTRNKDNKYNSLEYIKTALSQFCRYNYSKGFTSHQGSRQYMETLSVDDIDRELLKNIVKKRSYAEKNGYNIFLGSNKEMHPDLPQLDLEFLFIKNMIESPIDVEDYLLNKQPEDPNISSFRDRLIDSFVESRYFNESYGSQNLDNYPMDAYYKNILDKIDYYYDVLKKDKEKRGLVS